MSDALNPPKAGLPNPPLTEDELREIRGRGALSTDVIRLLDTIKADRAEIGRLLQMFDFPDDEVVMHSMPSDPRTAGAVVVKRWYFEELLKARTALKERDAALVGMREALKPFAEIWAKKSERYERINSDWHMRMPPHWPIEIKEREGLTVGDLRNAAALASGGLVDPDRGLGKEDWS